MNGQFIFLIIFIFLTGCSSVPVNVELRAPSMLPQTERQMKTAGFWIGRHPLPDKVIMTEEQITSFNQKTQKDLGLIDDLLKLGPIYSGKKLAEELRNSLSHIRAQSLCRLDGVVAGHAFYGSLYENMNFESLPQDIKVQYGFIVHYANQRLLPTDEGLYSKVGDVDFDELQNSALDVGTPIAILHETKDGQWVYTVGEISSGWVKKGQVAFCEEKEFADFLNKKDLAVVISPKTDIYLNPDLTQYDDYLKMGATLPLISENDSDVVSVLIPQKAIDGKVQFVTGYFKREDVHLGFLPYTPRTIMEQAFKMLNAPYGWGDMYGEQDCSRLIQEIFATVGIKMPRNSSAQGQVGDLLADFSNGGALKDKVASLKEAVAGTTVLYLKGHIMLYLGMVDERAFAIHATWAYRGKGCGSECVRVINRVAVSDLLLGEGSKKNSLLDRLIVIRQIRLTP